jgi:hypothetical protein
MKMELSELEQLQLLNVAKEIKLISQASQLMQLRVQMLTARAEIENIKFKKMQESFIKSRNLKDFMLVWEEGKFVFKPMPNKKGGA